VTLEKKSRELKELFDLKNTDLLKEKERTKDLVYSLLPREIAEQKMTSEAPIAPQVFSNCSFFYSDIKGFTSIVADLTNLEDGGPMDVVEMLDNLYTIMDKAIGKHNVVKIETIGDAYVVVSGLPVPDINGSAHARHIAAFALDVLSTTKDITVRRLNNRPVYMRIGIHSGSCVAGLAGNYMYHYCIYGKEPRYANNLESSGEANRIHMSDEMRKILERNFQHQFSFVERKPSVHISGFKSKSSRTWWLTGEAGVPREMPKDDIYKNLEFKRKTSSTTNPMLLIKGVAKLRGEVTSAHIRTLSESSEKSAKKIKNRSGTVDSNISKSTVGNKSNHTHTKKRGAVNEQ
jgi:class 3 adenylate cyclase